MPDIRQLPGMVPPGFENATIQVIAGQMAERVEEFERSIRAGTIENESDENPLTRCPFTFHGQIDPLFVPQGLINEYENEMDDPSGLPLENLPKLRLNGVLMSEECGILLELEDVTGISYVCRSLTSITRSPLQSEPRGSSNESLHVSVNGGLTCHLLTCHVQFQQSLQSSSISSFNSLFKSVTNGGLPPVCYEDQEE
jgi:hypothetical protein